jgi:hypothetical protein
MSETGDGTGSITLAFDPTAIERLADPAAVFTDARQWSDQVGIVSADPREAKRYAREHDLSQDFYTGNRARAASLELVKQQYDTGRYVFVGTKDSHERLADSTGWEYRALTAASDAAGWTLRDRNEKSLRARLAALLGL